jgi:hypothetical protein
MYRPYPEPDDLRRRRKLRNAPHRAKLGNNKGDTSMYMKIITNGPNYGEKTVMPLPAY